MEQQIYNYIEVLRKAFPAMKEKGLSPSERFLFLYLLHRANAAYWKDLRFSFENVSKETGISRRSLFSKKKRLISLGFLIKDEGWKINYDIFNLNSVHCNGKFRQYFKSGIPAAKFSPEEFARYKR